MSRIVNRILERDRGFDGARRALRAALAIPLAAAASFAVAGDGQAPVFAIIGSIALLIAVDFPGTRTTRAAAYAGLAVTGAVLITLGTLAAPNPWVTVPLCFAVGALVSFLGLLSATLAAGQRATLMTFLLPICTPVGPLADRLLGWLLALLICVPTALFLVPPRYSARLRERTARVCTALADRIEGAGAEELAAAMDEFRGAFLGTGMRPVALSAGGRALFRLTSNLQWLSGHVGPGTAALLGPIAAPSIAVLRDSAALLTDGTAERISELTTTVARHRAIAFVHYGDDIAAILAEPDDGPAIERGRMLLQRRTISATIGLTGSIIAASAAADARPVWARLLDRELPETGIADRVHTGRGILPTLAGYLSTRSITVLDSLRTGLALALALAVTLVLPIQNATWVVLGVLTVLRSSAATTRVSAVRALVGTVIGFALGAAVIGLLGVQPAVLWTLLPLVTFGSTYVLVVGSFMASQAMFTMMVLIVFNLIRPVGWQVGFIRVEDVAVGAAVGLVVSLLLWPGGARAAVDRAINGALAAGGAYLEAAVRRVTRGATAQTEAAITRYSRDALAAVRSYADAVRVYLSETNGAVDPEKLDAGNRIPRLRTAADLIADIVPPPADVFPRARQVLERHTTALCARLDGSDPSAAAGPMAEDFIPALRADATGSAESDAAVALPLVTAAANVGELELTF